MGFRKPLLVLAAALVALSGCVFSNMGTAQKFREMVDGVNEEARWSRLDLAVQRVHPAYKPAWRIARQEWGSEIQIADSEVTSLQIQDEEDTATSVVVVCWYRFDTMTLQTSTIEQRWERVSGRFALRSEEIVDGDEEVFFTPEEAEETSKSERRN